jgi:hypothetical protein
VGVRFGASAACAAAESWRRAGPETDGFGRAGASSAGFVCADALFAAGWLVFLAGACFVGAFADFAGAVPAGAFLKGAF